MASSLGPQTIAIAFDAGEATLVRRLMASGDMPVLAGLAARGGSAHVTSSAHIGSGSVWPTFASGTDLGEHGIHYIWRWEPAQMRLAREHGDSIVPWWRPLAQDGRRVLTLDVPYLPFADADGCVEVFEWGSHDRRLGSVQTRPVALAGELARDPGPHPFQYEAPPPHDHPTQRQLAAVSARASAGARLRGELAARMIGEQQPDLAFVVFSEIHHTSHLLWQTVAPDDPLFERRGGNGLDERALVDVFGAADEAVGRIVEAACPDARVAVFSLHGMRAAGGIPTLLHPLLVRLGYATAPRPGRMSPRDAARTAFAAAKAHAPEWARSAWRRSASLTLLNAVAGPTAMKAYDWDRTRAFTLPHDQHGWVRINLAGREARGTVPGAHYAGTCDELSAALQAARTQDGRRIVRRVIGVAEETGGPPPAHLPDLVVHWDDAAYDEPVHVAGTDIVARPDALRLTGKHTFEGFLVSGGMAPPGETVASHELHRLIAGR
ncbi:MAG: alkaline phosphatase family protein [Solirubrobacteraceae bacterium]